MAEPMDLDALVRLLNTELMAHAKSGEKFDHLEIPSDDWFACREEFTARSGEYPRVQESVESMHFLIKNIPIVPTGLWKEPS